MDVIRLIKDTDYPVISYAWTAAGQAVNVKEAYPPECSYVFERDGKLLYAVAVYSVVGPPIAYVEAVIRDPFQASDFKALWLLQAHLESVYRDRGIKKLVAWAGSPALGNHYEKLGYNKVGQFLLAHKEI